MFLNSRSKNYKKKLFTNKTSVFVFESGTGFIQFFANNVISSETTRILNALYQSSKNNLQGSFIVWDLVKTHWDALYDAYGHMDLLGEALETIVTNFDTLGQLKELKIAGEKLRNFKKNSFLGRGEEIVNFNIRWTEKYLNETVSVLSRLVSK